MITITELIKRSIAIHDNLKIYGNLQSVNNLIVEHYINDYRKKIDNNAFIICKSESDFINKISLVSLFLINEEYKYYAKGEELLKSIFNKNYVINLKDLLLQLDMTSVDDAIKVFQISIICCLLSDINKNTIDSILRSSDRRIMTMAR